MASHPPTPEAQGAPVPSSRERLLMSAKELFSRDGYENTSTIAIARQAGTSESQLMKHFGNKEGLLEAIFDSGWHNMAFIFQSIQQLDSPAEKLEAMLELIITSFERDRPLQELMLLEGRRIRKEGHMIMMTKGYLHFIGVVDAILSEMRARGELRPDVHNDAVRSALNSMFEGMMRDQIMARRTGFPAAYDSKEMRHIFKIVLGAFLAQPKTKKA